MQLLKFLTLSPLILLSLFSLLPSSTSTYIPPKWPISKPLGGFSTLNTRDPAKKYYTYKNNNNNKNNNPQYSYYEQTLDHFSYTPGSYATFKQRYLINSDFWLGPMSKTPLFVVLGAEASLIWQYGQFMDHARRLNALLIYIEHRYYGESNPAGSMEISLRNATLRGYFTSAQALQDYAEIILHLKSELNATKSPVIVAGGSYGGMLATWFRLKYPHTAHGALASSAPILYFDNITPQDCYFSVITKVFRETNETCYTIIRESWDEIDKLAAQPDGLSLLTKRFNLCSPLLNTTDLKEFLKDTYAENVQYNPPNSDGDNIKPICDSILNGMKNASGDLLTGIYKGVVAALGEVECYGVGKSASNFPLETVLGWDWQACSEMVMPIGQTLNVSMFPIAPFDLNGYIDACKKQYNVAPRAHWITHYFGGHDIQSVLERFGSNIIFSNGLKDPYSCGGALKSISNSIIALNSKNGSHCNDVFTRYSEPKWLIKQKEHELKIIGRWIKDYYARS